MIETVVSNPIVKSQQHLSVAFMSGSGIDGVQLRVSRVYDNMFDSKTGLRVKFRYCDHNGKMFPSHEAAKSFCLERGYLMPWRTTPEFKAMVKTRKGTRI